MPTASEVHRFDIDIAPALHDFMRGNVCDLNDIVDWVCYTFDVNSTDWLIDRITDEYEEFNGI